MRPIPEKPADARELSAMELNNLHFGRRSTKRPDKPTDPSHNK